MFLDIPIWAWFLGFIILVSAWWIGSDMSLAASRLWDVNQSLGELGAKLDAIEMKLDQLDSIDSRLLEAAVNLESISNNVISIAVEVEAHGQTQS